MHGCYDYPRTLPPTGADPSMIYSPPMDPEGLPAHLDNGNEANPMMGPLVRAQHDDEPLLGDLDSSGYSLTSLDTIARSMDRLRSTEV